VSSKACSEAPFIGQRREGAGWPKVGVRAACAASMVGTTALGACWHTGKDCGDSASALARLDDSATASNVTVNG
jgi:hypothetical protein